VKIKTKYSLGQEVRSKDSDDVVKINSAIINVTREEIEISYNNYENVDIEISEEEIIATEKNMIFETKYNLGQVIRCDKIDGVIGVIHGEITKIKILLCDLENIKDPIISYILDDCETLYPFEFDITSTYIKDEERKELKTFSDIFDAGMYVKKLLMTKMKEKENEIYFININDCFE